MKKFYFAAALAAFALSANAQYVAETPYMQPTLSNGQTFDIIAASADCFSGLGAAGKKINDWTVNEETRFLYVWDNTFAAGDSSFPGVGFNDMQFDGYASFTVGTVGWSGAGYCFVGGENTMHWNDNTRFHLAYRTDGTAPASIAVILADFDGINTPAKVALGEPFADGDKGTYPAVAPAAQGDWQALDISFSDLKKFYPAFAVSNTTEAKGNVFSFLGGGVTGRAFAFDCIYFYTPASESTVEGVEADNEIIFGANTVSALNGGIEIYDTKGALVSRTSGTVLGTDGLDKGIYIVKAGNVVKKIAR